MMNQASMDSMSCLSPIQEVYYEDNSNVLSPASSNFVSPASSMATEKISNRVSAFASLNDLKAKMSELSREKRTKIKIGGSIPREFIMKAVPESPYTKTRHRNMPSEADMEFLGRDLPLHGEKITGKNSYIFSEEKKRDHEFRDETAPVGNGPSEKRVDSPLNEIHVHMEADQPIIIATQSSDDVSAIDTVTTTKPAQNTPPNLGVERSTSNRQKNHKSMKKPIQRFAKSVWEKVEPLFRKSKKLFAKKNEVELKRNTEGHLV